MWIYCGIFQGPFHVSAKNERNCFLRWFDLVSSALSSTRFKHVSAVLNNVKKAIEDRDLCQFFEVRVRFEECWKLWWVKYLERLTFVQFLKKEWLNINCYHIWEIKATVIRIKMLLNSDGCKEMRVKSSWYRLI